MNKLLYYRKDNEFAEVRQIIRVNEYGNYVKGYYCTLMGSIDPFEKYDDKIGYLNDRLVEWFELNNYEKLEDEPELAKLMLML